MSAYFLGLGYPLYKSLNFHYRNNNGIGTGIGFGTGTGHFSYLRNYSLIPQNHWQQSIQYRNLDKFRTQSQSQSQSMILLHNKKMEKSLRQLESISTKIQNIEVKIDEISQNYEQKHRNRVYRDSGIVIFIISAIGGSISGWMFGRLFFK